MPSLFFEHMILNTQRGAADRRARAPGARVRHRPAADRGRPPQRLRPGAPERRAAGPARVRAGLRGLRARPGPRGRAPGGGGVDPRRRRHLREGRPRPRDPGRVLVRERAAPHHRAAHGRPGPRRRHPHRAQAHVVRPALRQRPQHGGLHRGDGGVRRRRGSEPHRAPRQRSDPDGGERVPRPERVPVERSGGRQPDAPLRPGDRRRRSAPRRWARSRTSWPARCP